MYDLQESQEMFEILPIGMNASMTPLRHGLATIFEDSLVALNVAAAIEICRSILEFTIVSNKRLFIAPYIK